MYRARNLLLAFALLLAILPSCKKDELKSVINQGTNPEKVPTMASTDVQTVISDSGHTKYRITTPLWLMFEEAKQPHWIFPNGVIAEELDTSYNVVAVIRCDSAYYNERQSLWELNGNVRINNVKKDFIHTNQLFWLQNEHKIYSDSFIHIEKGDRVIEGYGYVSDERLTTYTLKRVSAILPIDEQRMSLAGGGASDEQGGGTAGSVPNPSATTLPRGMRPVPQPAQPVKVK